MRFRARGAAFDEHAESLAADRGLSAGLVVSRPPWDLLD